MKDYLKALVQDRPPLQGRNLAREYLQARILGAMQRAGALEAMDWHKAKLDVGKFLEDPHDVAMLDKHHALRLLGA